MKKYALSALCLTLSSVAAADQDQQKIINRFDDQRMQTATFEQHQPKPVVQRNVQKQVEKPTQISITKAELAKQPELVIRAFLPAVMQGNADNVALLYPLYRQLDPQYQDAALTKWADAILAKKARNYTQSIVLYRELIAENPSATFLVRFQLAAVLFENNELDAAKDQFQKLRAEALPQEAQAVIEQYLSAINKRDSWSFSGGLTYLNDPNINNAPKSGTTLGNWHAPKRESAQGIGFNVNIGKKWSWHNGWFNELRLNGSGKYYWNNKKYNEMNGRASVGLGFQNAKYTVAFLPFMEQALYAGGSAKSETLKRFSKTSGAALETTYWLSPNWQLSGSYEYGEQRYDRRRHLNGNSHFASAGLVYIASAQQYWFGNLSYQRVSARDKDDAYARRGLTLGWGQEWGKGLSSRLSVSYAQKHYKGPMPIFNITQRNKEYGFQASVWHRAVHYFGITPRLTYHFSKTKSNYAFSNYDKHRVFLDFSKQF